MLLINQHPIEYPVKQGCINGDCGQSGYYDPNAEENKYTFEVDKNANKAEIKHAIETIFEGVKVKKVRTLNFTGKKVRTRYGYGKKADWKKAYVTLTEDSEAIEYFDGM